MATYQAKVLTSWRSEPGRNDMLVAEEYPAAWTDITWQADPLIGADRLNRLVALGEGLSEAQVAALQADARFAVLWLAKEGDEGAVVPPEDFTPEQAGAVRADVTAVLSSDIARMVTEDTASPDAIADAVREAILHAPFVAGEYVQANDIRYWQGNLFRVLQPHTTQADWPPDVAHSLFARYYEPSDDPYDWVAPQGAHDVWPLGARVRHKGAIWRSLIPNNAWEPGAPGTELLWELESGGEEPEPEPECPEFVQPTGAHDSYMKGDCVTFGGKQYISKIDFNVWSPAAYPAGWEQV